MRRFFVEGSSALGECVALTGGDAHKLVDVLRAAPGDRLEILDGRSRRFAGVVRQASRERVLVELVEELAAADRESTLAVTLVQGIPKGQKMDFVVEKAVELGVARIIPLLTERSVARAEGRKVERWRRLAKAAATQSGRTRIPPLSEPMTLDRVLALGSEHDAVIMPWELAEPRPLADRLAEIPSARRLLALIGPEGGFSQREAEQAHAAGALLISLGPRILRTETAGVVLIAALLALRREL
ncbi:MAG: 16S rRNA (uracil(1498)-N(3))-methyltransferase [bacterium]|nr:16S rRNA (uracil(1498)-N(3))-methyltransferase [bacterium]